MIIDEEEIHKIFEVSASLLIVGKSMENAKNEHRDDDMSIWLSSLGNTLKNVANSARVEQRNE
ncbi:MAG: hypothetical protein Alis3KO_00800 [Aliiglaciecola sp.]